VRPVPPHPDRKSDPTSPRKRGEVKEDYRVILFHASRPAILYASASVG